MKYKIIIFLLIMIIFTAGCSNDEIYEDDYTGMGNSIFVDRATCVEYFKSEDSYNLGNLFPRYNQDGSLKLNQKCLKNKKIDEAMREYTEEDDEELGNE